MCHATNQCCQGFITIIFLSMLPSMLFRTCMCCPPTWNPHVSPLLPFSCHFPPDKKTLGYRDQSGHHWVEGLWQWILDLTSSLHPQAPESYHCHPCHHHHSHLYTTASLLWDGSTLSFHLILIKWPYLFLSILSLVLLDLILSGGFILFLKDIFHLIGIWSCGHYYT